MVGVTHFNQRGLGTMPEDAVSIALLRQRMVKVEEGVANFREFQEEMREFSIDAKATERERARQHKQNLDRLNLIIVLLTLMVMYLGYLETVKHDAKSALHSSNPVVADYHAKED